VPNATFDENLSSEIFMAPAIGKTLAKGTGKERLKKIEK